MFTTLVVKASSNDQLHLLQCLYLSHGYVHDRKRKKFGQRTEKFPCKVGRLHIHPKS